MLQVLDYIRQNGDGKGDILIGAPKNAAGGIDAGRAYLYSGSIAAGGILLDTMTGEAGSLFGTAVVDDTDINLYGKSDCLISSYRINLNFCQFIRRSWQHDCNKIFFSGCRIFKIQFSSGVPLF